jgi:hypothetical protein
VHMSRTDLIVLGLVGSVAAGLGIVFLTSPIESGDYGQWLMASRYYSGLAEPAYRTISSVPPLVPFVISLVHAAIPDPVIALKVFGAGLLVLLAVAFYSAGAVLFASRAAGLVTVCAALLGTDQFLGLFAFGGLLQAAALVLMIFSVASFARAARSQTSAWPWWTLGSLCLVLAALSHLATGAIALVAGLAVASVSAMGSLRAGRLSVRSLMPPAVGLALVGAYWVLVLLPSSEAYVTNPASLNYRGSDRLWEQLTGYWPTIVVIVAAGAALVAGLISEIRRRRIGPYVIVLVWTALTAATLAYSIMTGAATDYPRFATPLLAPLAVGAGGGIAAALRWSSEWLHTVRPVVPAGAWLAPVTALVLATAPLAVDTYQVAARGYRLTDMASLQQAASWIAANVPAGATVLTPVREGKWVEGLTGRAALFDNPIRYSFRPDEWARSTAANTLLQSSAAIVNEFFFVRFIGGDPCATGTASQTASPGGLIVGSNHGGEYLDLLGIPAAKTRVIAPGTADTVLATVANLRPASVTTTSTPSLVRMVYAWTGTRNAGVVGYKQVVTVRRYASTLELAAVANSPLAIRGLELDLQPAAGVALIGATIRGAEADLEFTRMGLTAPRLRLTIAKGAGTFARNTAGGLRVISKGRSLRLLVTDLTASERRVAGLQLMCPQHLGDTYDLGAVLLKRDPSFASRVARMEAIGFRPAASFGPYVVLARAGQIAPIRGLEP